jgi:hypothetical protein
MAPAARHPDKALRAVLEAAGRQGWRIKKTPRGYFKIYCPCAEKHFKTVHISPNQAYLRNLVSWLRRETCWKEDK